MYYLLIIIYFILKLLFSRRRRSLLKEDPQRYESVNDLWTVIAFVLGSHQCRWQYLCEYFDEDHVAGNRCNICDICNNRQYLVEFNITLLLELMGKSLMELNAVDVNILKDFALGRKSIGKNNVLLHNQYFGFLRYFDNIFFNKIMATYVRQGMSDIIFRNTRDLVTIIFTQYVHLYSCMIYFLNKIMKDIFRVSD